MPLMRGLIPTPRAKLLRSLPFLSKGPVPATVSYVPKRLSMWGNDQYGSCVTTEEAFAKACALPEIFISDAEVIRWAGRHGWLDGAELTPVIKAMIQSGFQQDSHVYGDGPYRGVDFSDEDLLKNALVAGPVKIGIDADALPNGAGNESGWFSLGTGRHYNNEDHCVSLCGYGTASELYKSLGLSKPSQLRDDQQGYLLFTWNTIGFVDHSWIMSTTGEAYVRDPVTTVDGVPLTPPAPPVPPTPTPVPSGLPTKAQLDALVALVRPLLPDGSPMLRGSPAAIDWASIISLILAFIQQFLKPQPVIK